MFRLVFALDRRAYRSSISVISIECDKHKNICKPSPALVPLKHCTASIIYTEQTLHQQQPTASTAAVADAGADAYTS